MRNEMVRLVDGACPGLLDQALGRIRDSEAEYTGTGGEGFLVDHTRYVVSVAYKLACMESIDPLVPVLAALFHDAGKFHQGEYHQGEVAEEERSAQLAGELMEKSGVHGALSGRVCEAIRALYNQAARANVVADLVHDADFLTKFGYVGVAQFFIKAALRQRPLLPTVRQSMSKELTYASVLVANMRTRAGKELGAVKQRRTLDYFDNLLRELREDGVLAMKVERFIARPTEASGEIPVVIVREEACERCGAETAVTFRQEQGVKCTKVIADIRCPRCANHHEIAFCLPEVVSGAVRS